MKYISACVYVCLFVCLLVCMGKCMFVRRDTKQMKEAYGDKEW